MYLLCMEPDNKPLPILGFCSMSEVSEYLDYLTELGHDYSEFTIQYQKCSQTGLRPYSSICYFCDQLTDVTR